MNLKKNLLEEYNYREEYFGYHNALGLYDSMQFVLRLRTDVHQKMKVLTDAVQNNDIDNIDFEGYQAYSTYLHETIHWWQHIGSISGLILSLSYPSQTHLNQELLEEYLKKTGKIKSIDKYNKQNATEFNPNKQTEEFIIINFILNNYHDIEFFKYITINPKLINEIRKNPYFESVGNSFHITYSAFINIIASCFDYSFDFLPDLENWQREFYKLNANKITGHYFDSDIYASPFGLKEIYEGQARLIQIQFLYFASGENLIWKDFDALGMLNGVYIEAFNYFLEAIGEDRPDSIDSPLVALFLLVCDIAINPGEGFPFDINDFEQFIYNVDPGARFIYLCKEIKEVQPEVKYQIKEYSNSEYYSIALTLCNGLKIQSPMDISNIINKWSLEIDTLVKLMEEEKVFDFSNENFSIRLIFSRFIRFQQDKLNNPAFFCWPGVYKTKYAHYDYSEILFNEHQALFVDGLDADIYPRVLPNKTESATSETMNKFYTWVTLYDLTKQLIIDEGDFEYDYLWLTSKFSNQELEKWAKDIFKRIYGCSPDDFEII